MHEHQTAIPMFTCISPFLLSERAL